MSLGLWDYLVADLILIIVPIEIAYTLVFGLEWFTLQVGFLRFFWNIIVGLVAFIMRLGRLGRKAVDSRN